MLMSLANVSFLGPIGGPEIIMIMVVLFLLVLPAVIVIVVLKFSGKPSHQPMPPPLPQQKRLMELEALKASNLISEAEYEQKRKEILSSL